MDKTLEIVMVAVALVVAVVIVTGILQGSANGFVSFSDQHTNSSSCGVATSQFESAVTCDGSGTAGLRATSIYQQNSGCITGSGADDAKSSICS